jgi:transcriptional regulator with XRE-family HTH domain
VSDSLALALSRAIRAERARAGLTQEALAERLGWSRQVLTAVETGSRRLYAHELPDVCYALGVTLADLLDRADEADREALGIKRHR